MRKTAATPAVSSAFMGNPSLVLYFAPEFTGLLACLEVPPGGIMVYGIVIDWRRPDGPDWSSVALGPAGGSGGPRSAGRYRPDRVVLRAGLLRRFPARAAHAGKGGSGRGVAGR